MAIGRIAAMFWRRTLPEAKGHAAVNRVMTIWRWVRSDEPSPGPFPDEEILMHHAKNLCCAVRQAVLQNLMRETFTSMGELDQCVRRLAMLRVQRRRPGERR